MSTFEVLVVDDSPTMRLLVIRGLRRIEGVRCTESCDGMDALRKLSEDHFDLALAHDIHRV